MREKDSKLIDTTSIRLENSTVNPIFISNKLRIGHQSTLQVLRLPVEAEDLFNGVLVGVVEAGDDGDALGAILRLRDLGGSHLGANM